MCGGSDLILVSRSTSKTGGLWEACSTFEHRIGLEAAPALCRLRLIRGCPAQQKQTQAQTLVPQSHSKGPSTNHWYWYADTQSSTRLMTEGKWNCMLKHSIVQSQGSLVWNKATDSTVPCMVSPKYCISNDSNRTWEERVSPCLNTASQKEALSAHIVIQENPSHIQYLYVGTGQWESDNREESSRLLWPVPRNSLN